MKAALKSLGPVVAASLMLGACVPSATAPAPAPAPVARPAPARPLPPPVVQAPVTTSWMDAGLTPGAWNYDDQNGGGMAVFSGGRGEPLFMLECDRETGPAVMLYVTGTGGSGTAGVIRTETATRTLPMTAIQGGHQATLDPRDPLLDAMALSKGRFAVEATGRAPLILPSHAEVSRVIEDCR